MWLIPTSVNMVLLMNNGMRCILHVGDIFGLVNSCVGYVYTCNFKTWNGAWIVSSPVTKKKTKITQNLATAHVGLFQLQKRKKISIFKKSTSQKSSFHKCYQRWLNFEVLNQLILICYNSSLHGNPSLCSPAQAHLDPWGTFVGCLCPVE